MQMVSVVPGQSGQFQSLVPLSAMNPPNPADGLALCIFSFIADLTVVQWSLTAALAGTPRLFTCAQAFRALVAQVKHVICLEPHPAQALEGVCCCCINTSVL